MDYGPRPRPIFFGLALITVGVLFLLREMDFLPDISLWTLLWLGLGGWLLVGTLAGNRRGWFWPPLGVSCSPGISTSCRAISPCGRWWSSPSASPSCSRRSPGTGATGPPPAREAGPEPDQPSPGTIRRPMTTRAATAHDPARHGLTRAEVA